MFHKWRWNGIPPNPESRKPKITGFPSKLVDEPAFLGNLIQALDAVSIDHFIGIGEFVAGGGDPDRIGDHGGLDDCACVKCGLHKQLMKIAIILGQVHKKTPVIPIPDDEQCPEDCECPGCC